MIHLDESLTPQTPTNHIIRLDDAFARSIGFTSDKFLGMSYLWRSENRIVISMIASTERGKGHLRELFRNIEAQGFKIQVSTPFAGMRAILEHYGFVQGWELDEFIGESVEIWQKP